MHMTFLPRTTIIALFLTTTGAMATGNHAHADADADAGTVGQVSEVKRTVNVALTDNMRFNPDNISVKEGETIRFIVRNLGKIKHEFVLGSAREIKEHYDTMKKFPNMEHADASMLTVQPQQSKELIWRFDKSGIVEFACLQPGHYDSGMKGSVLVSRK